MNFSIYTAGSAEFLEMMLNASAMLTGSGRTADLVRIGALLGVLLVAFQAVFNAQAISFQKIGVMLVLYMVFYGPTATVTIQDTVNGQVRVVNNISLGPAFVGSVISTVSYDITKASEQAFSTPGMTEYGLFSSLINLSKVRQALSNPLSLQQFQTYKSGQGHNLPKTLDEYLTFCTLNPVSLRTEQNIDQLYRAASRTDLMSNTATSQYVYVYDGASGGTLKNCAAARTYLNSALADVYGSLLTDILEKGFAQEKASGQMPNANAVQTSTQHALQSLALSSKLAQEYVLSSLILPIFSDARVKALEHWHEDRAAMALRESLNQQEIQWAGRGDSFKTYMRPMIAFFEGLLYAITPFMAFALVLGGPGISVLGKYLILPLAVGLWMPLLSIVNAFTLWYAGAQMEAVFASYDSTSTGFALLQVLDIDQAISKALGVGGLLAASVPPLALFIVSGSSMVMNSVMRPTIAAEKFQSEDILPRSSSPAPVLSMPNRYQGDHLTQGVALSGSREAGPQISAQQAADAAVESSRAAAETKTNQLQQNLQAGVTQLSSTATGRQVLTSLGEQMQSGLNLSANSAYMDAARKLKAAGVSEDVIAQGTFAVAAGLGNDANFTLKEDSQGNKNTGSDEKNTDSNTKNKQNEKGRKALPSLLGMVMKYGLGVDAGARLSQAEHFSQSGSAQQQQAVEAAAQMQEAIQASMNESTVFSAADAFTRSNAAMSQSSHGETLSKSVTSARSSQEAYRQAQSHRQGWGAGQNLDLGTAAALSIQNSGKTREEAARGMLDIAGQTQEDRDRIRSLMDTTTIQNISSDLHERQVAASTLHMIQSERLGELVTSPYSPFNFRVDTGNAQEQAGLDRPIAGANNLQQRFNGLYGASQEQYTSERDMADSGHQGTAEIGHLVVNQGYETGYHETLRRNQTHHDQLNIDLESLSRPLEKPEVVFDTTKPITDTDKGIVSPITSPIKQGIDNINQGIDDFHDLLVEERKAADAMRDKNQKN